MEKHKCKLCLRNFANGRALGGHMRSHTMNLHVQSSKIKQQEHLEEKQKNYYQDLSEEIESVPSNLYSSSSSEEENEEEDKGLLLDYGLRENPKKSSRFVVDREFSFAVEAAGSVVLDQDRESETESSKNPICRRSKRMRKPRNSDTHHQFSGFSNMKEEAHVKKHKSEKEGKSPIESPLMEPEPVSSISDTTPEEDVAYCLMMLSRDKWLREENGQEDEYGGAEEEEEEEEEQPNHHVQVQQQSEKEKKTKKDAKDHCHDSKVVVKVTKSRTRGKYRCETCNKVFRSYQALGGHRASHKRIKVNISNSTDEPAGTMLKTGNAGGSNVVEEEKIHECPVCYKVFSCGQALGGHKRSHFIGAASLSSIPAKPFSRFGETLIDLNLPAPIDDDDDISQIEHSAVSDSEFSIRILPREKTNDQEPEI